MPKRPPTYRGHRPPAPRAENRPSACKRGYDARWRDARAAYLAENPLCVECRRNNVLAGADVVDHITPHRGDESLFWDRDNWQPLCKPCHDRKTGAGA